MHVTNKTVAHSEKLILDVKIRLILEKKLHFLAKCLSLFFISGIIIFISLNTLGILIATPQWVFLVAPLIFSILAILYFQKEVTVIQAAKRIDAFLKTKDLFLTVANGLNSDEGFASLVIRKANTASIDQNSKKIVPINVQQPFLKALLFMGIQGAAILWYPSFDLLGVQKSLIQFNKEKKKELNLRKATAKKLVKLKKASLDNKFSKNVDKALAKLSESFKIMKPNNNKLNRDKLQKFKNELQKLWSERSEANDLRSLRDSLRQSLALNNGELSKQMKDLAQGNPDGMEKSLAALKSMLNKISKEENTDKAKEESRKLAKKIQQMLKSMNNGNACQSLKNSLNRSLEQLEMSNKNGMNSQMLSDVMDSLNLSSAELQAQAQSIRDMQELEQALDAVRKANSLNKKNALGKKGTDSCSSMADYASLYEQLLKQINGVGRGMNGPGTGRGGLEEHYEGEWTEFQPEISPSKITAGKMLLSWKQKGQAPIGKDIKNYQNILSKVKQNAEEAIKLEGIPPGYHNAIQKYFSKMSKTDIFDGSKKE